MSEIRLDRVERDEVLVHVLVAAEPATVWSFLSDGDRFASWIGAYGGGPPLPGTHIDPKVGGSLRVCYPGQGVAATGKITAMEPMRRIAFSWGYEDGHDGIAAASTQIEINLTPMPDGTWVQLRHVGIPSDGARQGHIGGWKHYLSMLAGRAAERQHGDRLAGLWADYFRAWSESDEAARRRMLANCCEPAVRLRTAFACTDGIEAFSQHVANALKHMPGVTLKMDGAPQLSHGFTRVGWTVEGPGGQTMMRGENFAGLSLGGKFATMISFPAGQ